MHIPPINALVSASMHPAVLDPQAALLGNHPALAAGREALDAIYRTTTAMVEAERRLAAVPKNPGRMRQRPDGTSEYLGDLRMSAGGVRQFHGHEDEFREASRRAFDRAAQVFDRRREEIARHRATLAEAVDAALKFDGAHRPEGVAIAGEVRSMLRGLPKAEDRLQLVSKAIAQGDKQTAWAVLSAPPMLSGLSAEQLVPLRSAAALAWAQRESAQLDAIDTVLRRLEMAAGAFKDQYAKVQALKPSPAASARAILQETLGDG